MQEHGQLYVYQHRCICCTTPFQTIDKNQTTCSPKCYLIWNDPDQYVKRFMSAEGEKPTALDLLLG